jgi:hypothetical protein
MVKTAHTLPIPFSILGMKFLAPQAALQSQKNGDWKRLE